MPWSAQDYLNSLVIRVVVPAVRDHLDRVWQATGSRQTWVEYLQARDATQGAPAAPARIASDMRTQLALLSIPEVATEQFGLTEDRLPHVAAALALVNDLAGPAPAAVTDRSTVAEAFWTFIALLTDLGLEVAAEQVREAEAAFRGGTPVGTPATGAPAPGEDTRPDPFSAYVQLSVPAVYSYTQAHLRALPFDLAPVERPEWQLPGWRLDLALTSPAGPLGAEVSLPLGLEGEALSDRERRALVLPLVDLRTLERIDQTQEAILTAVLRRNGTEVARSATTLTVLAPRLWQFLVVAPVSADGTPVGPGRVLPLSVETLASFVQPNDPAIAALARDASDLLTARTGEGSLEGYQSGDPVRVDAIARALFDAMQARDIRYVEPPANWVDLTQQIRTPEEVLTGVRQGTCLDTSVVYAAALEFAGLRPLLWLTDGHIFTGYWRVEDRTVDTSVDTPEELANHVDMRAIQLVETTQVASRQPVDWELMHRRLAQAHVHAGFVDGSAGSQLIGDVHLLRTRDRIIPLPSRIRREDGTVQVVEYAPQHSRPGLVLADRMQPTDDRPGRPAEPPRIEQWKNALLDLSLRNRLLNFPRSARLPLWVPAERLGDFEDALLRGAAFTLRAMDDVPATYAQGGVASAQQLPEGVIEEYLFTTRVAFLGAATDAYTTALRGLSRTARTILEETGANNLYLSVGNLRWTSGAKELWSPLVLIPVTLRPVRGGHQYRLSLDDTGTSTPNYSLLERLRKEFDLEIPGFAEPVEDGAGLDIDALFTAIRTAMTQARLPFTVEPHVDLAILQFGKFRLWKDIDEAWETLARNHLVHHLVHTPTQMFADPAPEPAATDLDELTARLPIAADSSQARAIQLALAGRTMVIEGPPGTGKSQTITNLLARAMADGKKVLFVAEKQAALEVVSKRLDEVGVGPFVLNLHDRGQKPAAVKTKLRAALEYVPAPDHEGLATSRTRMEQSRRRLAAYRDQVHAKNPVGLSAYTAHTRLLALGDEVTPAPIGEDFVHTASAPAVDAVRRAGESISDLGAVLTAAEGVPWQVIGRAVPEEQADAFFAAATELDAAVRDLTAALGNRTAGLRPIVEHLSARQHLQQLRTLEEVPWLTWPLLREVAGPAWQQAARTLRADLALMERLPVQALATYDPAVLHFDLAAIRTEWRGVERKMFGGRQRRHVMGQIDRFRRPEATVTEDAFGGLLDDLVLLQEKGATVLEQVRGLVGVQAAPDWQPYDPQHRADALARLDWVDWSARIAWPTTDPELAQAQQLLADGYAAPRPLDSGQGPRAAALARLEQALVGLETYVSPWEPGFLGRWTRRREHAGAALLTSAAWRRWNDLLVALQPLAEHGLTEAYDGYRTGALPLEDARLGLGSGLARAALGERLHATGLGSFDPQRHAQDVERFATFSGTVRQQLRTVLPQEILDRRTFTVAGNRGRIGELSRQLSGRKRVEIRRLIAEYGDLITEITPCVLVSPDSASRFFPPGEQLFDLVVFDEASQIRVADAIGAMGRGRSAVIVGDSKQMPPTSIAEAAAVGAEQDESAGPEAVEDEESILTECIQAGVSRMWLSWHYRSEDESLIAFSNQQYYEGRLSSFPAPVQPGAAARDGRGIRLVSVDGEFRREGKGKLLRTNQIEADAVVDEIRRRFDADPEGFPSLGVVTFNVQQRNLIENRLRDLGDERVTDALEDPEGVFVKNLENVQGDERDTILFSTAFSKNGKGVLPLNFGPLNRVGGERRLNVAITRARREVMIFSSFAPQDLRVEDSSSEGLKDLRAYLELAQRGTAALQYRGGKGRVEVDRHRDEVAEALRARGLAVRTSVGLSDFRIDLVLALPGPDGHEGEPLVAVLLDSVPWSQRATTGDRDALPVDVLGGKLHWPAVQRAWLPEWLQDPAGVTDRLVEVTRRAAVEVAAAEAATPAEASLAVADPPLDDVSAGPGEPGVTGPGVEAGPARGLEPQPLRGLAPTTVSRADPVAPEEEVEAPTSVAGVAAIAAGARVRRDPDSRTAFMAWELTVVGDQAMLNAADSDDEARAAVQRVAREIVDVEFPIRPDRLISLTCAAFDLRRVRQTRRESVVGILQEVGFHRDAEGFVWPADLPPQPFRGYRPDALLVPGLTIDDVHPAEMRNIVGRTQGEDPEELNRMVLNVLGGKRLTEGISARISEALG